MAKLLHDKRFIWALFILIAFGIFTIFFLTSINAGQGNLLMPLDDVYIHFQYARQMATGHPYQYNNIDPATSGATSFIYPYILAFGYLIGFQGLWLGLWAMLIGTVALIAAMWAVYRLCKAVEVPQYLSLLTAVSFALTGSIAWHFMSGMETGIMTALTLWTLLLVIEKRFRSFLLIATLLSLIRPEGGVLAMIASGTMFLRLWRDFGAQEKRGGKRIQLLFLAIPILAIGVQPLVNLLITGTTVATGNQAKSILATIPQDWGVIVSRIVDNFLRMWWEFITGYDALEGRGWYLPLFTGLLGLLSIPILLFKKNYRLIGLMLLGWLLAMTAAISTLDTAFWHFKRYQIPMMALFFPLAAWVVSLPLPKSLPINREGLQKLLPLASIVYSGAILPIFAIVLFFQFLHYHAVNVGYVYQQPYQMALWLRNNTPEDSIIAVHDVGLMRYMGERNTLDIVGLTTSGAAAYWRNGPGSVAEFLINNRPDYIANYGRGHGYGLAYLADTSLYENELATFPIENWQRHLNVALAADFQGIYEPEWIKYEEEAWLPHLQVGDYFYARKLAITVSTWQHYIAGIDIGNLASENDFRYRWQNLGEDNGFVTEVYQWEALRHLYSPYYVDSVRRINDFEEFTISLPTDVDYDILQQDVLLVTRLHPIAAGSFDVYVNDVYIDTRWIPQMPGVWLEIATIIPSEYVSNPMRIKIVPNLPDGSYYMPASHILWSKRIGDVDPELDSVATYQNGAFYFWKAFIWNESNLHDSITPELCWYTNGAAQGDYRFFLHLYDDRNQPPVAQRDLYLRGVPLGSLLPTLAAGYQYCGIRIDIENVPSGTYQLAIGFYNPQNPQDRLIPESDIYEVTPDGRLWLGEITIGDE